MKELMVINQLRRKILDEIVNKLDEYDAVRRLIKNPKGGPILSSGLIKCLIKLIVSSVIDSVEAHLTLEASVDGD